MLILTATITGAQAQSSPTALDDYVELIDAAEAALAQATPDEANAVLAEQTARLATVESVRYPSGEIVSVAPLLSADDDHPLTPYAALTRLRTMQAQLAAAPGDDIPGRLAILDSILARPEFNNPVSLLERIFIWLRDLLQRWFPNLTFGGSRSLDPRIFETILWVLGGVGVVTAIVLLTGWIRKLAQSILNDAATTSRTLSGDLPRTAAEARQQAQDAAQSGAYRDAVRRLYLAALLHLAEAHLLSFDPSLTNLEVLARVRHDSPVRPFLEPVIATFDRVWYGMHEPDQATFDSYASAIDALDRAAQQAGTQPGASG